jgi:hypothetical protein
MAEKGEKSREELRSLQSATEGVGALLQRDFRMALEDSQCKPEDVMDLIRRAFPRFSPDLLAKFTRPDGSNHPLNVGDTMHVRITGGGHAGVQVTHLDERSMTLHTQEGHMEAGRITFGAYHDKEGRLVCHIRSRSRIRDYPRLAEYWLGGKAAQTSVWVTFLERLGEACGGRQTGDVQVTTEEVADTPADAGDADTPTFSPWDPPAEPENGGGAA